MKKLKFLIVILAMFIADGAVAVTLPSTSYSPYESGISTDGSFSVGGGSSFAGQFFSLGTGGEYGCKDHSDKATCSSCCDDNWTTFETMCSGSSDPECVMAMNLACINECEGNDSIPLDDTPLDESTLLLIMVCAAAFGVSIFKYHKQHQL